MPVCFASTLAFDGSAVHWAGPEGAEWHLPAERIRVIGECVDSANDGQRSLVFVIDAEGAWLQAPAHASGLDRALGALARYLGSETLSRREDVDEHGRVLWPEALVGHALFASGESQVMRLSEAVIRFIADCKAPPT